MIWSRHGAALAAVVLFAFPSWSARANPAPAGHPASAAPVRSFHEPLVRYLLADLQLGGSLAYYQKFAEEEGDPDSRRAVKEWLAGTRLLEPERLERKVVEGRHGKGMRIVWRGTNDTVPGEALRLTTDLGVDRAKVRLVIADLTLGATPASYRARRRDPSVARALDHYADAVRAVRTQVLAVETAAGKRAIVWAKTGQPIDGAFVELTSDVTYDEGMVRYQQADMALGGAPDFYRKIYDDTHDPMSGESLRRHDSGYRVTNLDRFERKRVAGQTLITYKGTDTRIDGYDVQLSSDLPGAPSPRPKP